MMEMLKITLNLVVTFVVAGILMASVYAKTEPVKVMAQQKEKQEALKKLIPDADSIKEAGKWSPFNKRGEYYEAKKGNENAGYIISTYGKGYSSFISILVALDPSMKVRKISVLEHAETPGLGDEIEQAYFQKRFEGKSLEQLQVVKVEGTDKVQAISGATISSRAVTNGVREGVKLLKEKYQGSDAGARNEGK